MPAEQKAEHAARADALENEYCRVTFDGNMNISGFYDKKLRRELLPEGALGARLIAFEDKPGRFDAWNIMTYYDEKYEYVVDVQSTEIIENSALRIFLSVTRKFRDSLIRADYTLRRGRPGLTIAFDVEWHENDTLLKLDFPADVNATKATFDIQFGSVERPYIKTPSGASRSALTSGLI